ncbi:MAG: deoxyribodipyrimidine photo-lyase, partial [Gemmatimonadetes bacterium]|nr:deoxyribodipyrimidine photo-lyase [Gemmatimonadota bacterium]
MSGGTIVVRFGSDLRLTDNPALHHAVEEGDSLVALFVWAPEEEADWPPGGAHRWWLHSTLEALSADLEEAGLPLILRAGSSASVLADVVEATGARAVFWNTRHTPAAKEADAALKQSLEEAGTEVRTFASYLLHDPDAIQTGAGGPYRVFSPFWRKAKGALEVGEPLPRPAFAELTPLDDTPPSDELESFELTPEAQDGVDWASGLREAWTPGEEGARGALRDFVADRLIDYVEARDAPHVNGTSRLSPYLHHGELSPRQVWHAVQDWVQNGPMRKAADGFLEEIGWREFSYHVLHHYPDTLREPL